MVAISSVLGLFSGAGFAAPAASTSENLAICKPAAVAESASAWVKFSPSIRMIVLRVLRSLAFLIRSLALSEVATTTVISVWSIMKATPWAPRVS